MEFIHPYTPNLLQLKEELQLMIIFIMDKSSDYFHD